MALSEKTEEISLPEEYKSPAEWLYSSWDEVPHELGTNLLSQVMLIMSMWQLSHEKELKISAPSLQDWIDILWNINSTQPQNPLEELSHFCQQEQNAEEQESSSSNGTSQSQQGKQREEQELDEELDPSVDVAGEYRIKQRDFDHPASAAFPILANTSDLEREEDPMLREVEEEERLVFRNGWSISSC